MSSICLTRITCVLILCLSPVFTEVIEKCFSNFSSIKHSSNFNDGDKNLEYAREKQIREKWKNIENSVIKILTVMYNESVPFISQLNKDLNISLNCKRDLIKMLTGFKEFEYWAVQMIDSFGILPTGIGSGTYSAFGDYDQCLNVNVPDHFQGQYCNLDLIVPMPKRQPFVAVDSEIPELMNTFKPDGFFSVLAKYGNLLYFINPRVSVCVPSTCSKEELQMIANKAVQNLNLSFGLQIPNCEVLNKEVKFDLCEIAIMNILGILVFLAISATVVDVYLKSISKEGENKKNSLNLPTKFLLCFSLHTNAKRLMMPVMEEDSIKVFHGMRVLTTVWVIVVHSFVYQNYQAISSRFYGYQYLVGKLLMQFISNGFINVQTFFFMSGTLHSISVMKMRKKINVKKHIFRRIWRLLPTFMLVICCFILVPHLGSGPIWKETIYDLFAKKCRATWWTNFLFINNFMSNEDLCLQWLWYVSVDFHLYLVSLLVLIPIKSNPILAFTINFFIMIGSIVISAVFHVYYKLTPMLVFAFGHPEDLNYFLERGYFRTYLHSFSVCIGLIVGYFLSVRPRKLHIPAKINATLWLSSLSICVALHLLVCRWNQGYIPSSVISVLYAVGSKILWAACMAWITIACTTGNGGIVTTILSWPVFVPLSRICYMISLIHPVFHYMYIGSTRLHIRADLRTFVYIIFGNIVSSVLCAIVLHLLFESPFIALDKLLFSEGKLEKSKQSKTVDKLETKNEEQSNERIFDKKNMKKKLS